MDDTRPILTRLLDGDRLFVPGGSNESGSVTKDGIGHWYAKVKRSGKYLHTTKVNGGVEMWADDTPAQRSGRSLPQLHRRKYESA